jgi:dihydropteroate synthase
VNLRLRERVVELDPARPLLMGIVNANPDSFSDAVRLGSLRAQVDHALGLVEAGADIVDVGGESGVTYTGVSEAELETERVLPLVRRLVKEGVTVSVDTFKPEVAEAVLDAGAAMINDVSGLRDERLAALCAATGAALVITHTRAAPKEEHFFDYQGDVVGDVMRFLAARAAVAVGAGMRADQLLLDPGPDFAKTPAETIEVLRALERLRALRRPLLLAVSRKYFIGAITHRPPAERLGGTLAAVAHAVEAGAGVLRVHDVAEAADFLAVRRVLSGADELGAFDPDDEALKWIRSDSR